MFKKSALALAACLLAVLAGLPAAAQAARTYVVLPYEYFGPAMYQHYGNAIRSEMSRQLRMPGEFEPIQEYALDGQVPAAPTSTSEAAMLLSRLGADYLVHGSITVAGQNAVMVTEVKDDQGASFSEEIEVPLDELSLSISGVARSLKEKIFPSQNAPAPGEEGVRASPANPEILAADTPRNQEAMRAINPQFRYEGGAQTEGRWQSQGFRFPSRSFTVCDGDGDGRNEVFILGDVTLYAFRYEEQRLVKLAEMELNARANHLRLSSLDMDRDGAAELVLTSYRDERPDSTILSFKGGRFATVMEDIDYFLNVIRVPPHYSPVLIGQPHGERAVFENDKIYEMLVTGGKVVPGKNMLMPTYASVFNTVYLPEGDNDYKVVVVDEFSRINVFNSQMEPLSQTQDTYNSSSLHIMRPNVLLPGMGESKDPDDILNRELFLPLQMEVTNLIDPEKYELIVNKDLSVAMAVFNRFRTFIQGELHAMFWDGTGLNLSWKTRRIKGTIMGYQIADLTGNGKQELLVLVNTYPGSLQLEYRKTMVIAYELNL